MSASGDAPLWDAVVVGGGPAGSAAAISLARAGRRALLVERRAKVPFKLGESIPPQARPFVEALLRTMATEPESAEAATGCFRTHGNVACWGSSEPAVQDFVFSPSGHGLRLDRPRFDRALRRRAEAAGATVSEGAGVRNLERSDPWELEVAGRVHRARFLVDCSGRSAVVARRCDARRYGEDRLFAFARVYQPPEDPGEAAADADTLTRIEAAPDGWWYSARLPGAGGPDGGRLVVFHTDRDLPAARRAARAGGFEELLAATTHLAPLLRRHGYRVGDAAGSADATPRGAPAGGERLDRFFGRGWIAAGDAAQAFDPLSSQGIGTALDLGFAAGTAVARALDGDGEALERYAEAQEAIHAAYLRDHARFYAAETRWPDRPFWQRRHGERGDHLGTPVFAPSHDAVLPPPSF